MEMSENINELAKALSAAQGELSNAKCDTKAHGYNYAKLVQYIEIAKPVLPKHGLSVSQLVDSDANGRVIVSTMLLHSSGQYLKSSAAVPDAVLMGGAGKNPIQVAGSQITYMRRYQYAAILGMTDNAEDNDAQGLVAPSKPKQPQPKPQPQHALQPMPADMFSNKKDQWIDDLWSDKYQFPALAAKAKAAGFVFTPEQAELLLSGVQERNNTLEEMA